MELFSNFTNMTGPQMEAESRHTNEFSFHKKRITCSLPLYIQQFSAVEMLTLRSSIPC